MPRRPEQGRLLLACGAQVVGRRGPIIEMRARASSQGPSSLPVRTWRRARIVTVKVRWPWPGSGQRIPGLACCSKARGRFLVETYLTVAAIQEVPVEAAPFTKESAPHRHIFLNT